jgi:hypothetical protein
MDSNTQAYIIETNKLNRYSLPFIFLTLLFFIPGYFFLHGIGDAQEVPTLLTIAIFGIPAFVLGNLLHEIVHALSWLVFGRVSLKDIKFGADFKSISAYAHLKTPISLRSYRISVVLPGLIVGLIPALYAMFSGSFLFLLWGVIFTISAASDYLVLKLLTGLPGNIKVSDHPEEIGCLVYSDIPPTDRGAKDILNGYLLIMYIVLIYLGTLFGMKYAHNIRQIIDIFIS